MEFEINDIKEKVENYFEGTLTKEELGQWAKRAYYDLLIGGYLETKKIVAYPFLKVISNFHTEEDDIRDIFPCDSEEITYIRDVLSGRYNQSYSIEIGIPWKIKSHNLELNQSKRQQYIKLINILDKCYNTLSLTEEDYNECSKVLKMEPDKPGSIQAVLETYIRTYLTVKLNGEDSKFKSYQAMNLYVHKRKTEKDILNKVRAYLECYVGRKGFEVNIVFILGEPQIILDI